MARKIAIMMDDIGGFNLPHDNSFYLLREAITQGMKIFYFTPDQLHYQNGAVLAFGQDLRPHSVDYTYELGDYKTENLADYDAVLIRQNPPFDMAYLTTTYVLDLLPPRVRVINRPSAIRNFSEKTLPLHFKAHIPQTLIAQDYNRVIDFAKTIGPIVCKPLYGRHGQRVFVLRPGDENTEAIIRTMLGFGEPIIAQEFLPAIYDGSKRVVVVDGQVLGAFRQVPPRGSILSGYSDRSPYQKTDLTSGETAIMAELAAFLKTQDLFFAGVDLIGEKLIEVNVTSPSGLIPFETIYNIPAAKIFWQRLFAA